MLQKLSFFSSLQKRNFHIQNQFLRLLQPDKTGIRHDISRNAAAVYHRVFSVWNALPFKRYGLSFRGKSAAFPRNNRPGGAVPPPRVLPFSRRKRAGVSDSGISLSLTESLKKNLVPGGRAGTTEIGESCRNSFFWAGRIKKGPMPESIGPLRNSV